MCCRRRSLLQRTDYAAQTEDRVRRRPERDARGQAWRRTRRRSLDRSTWRWTPPASACSCWSPSTPGTARTWRCCPTQRALRALRMAPVALRRLPARDELGTPPHDPGALHEGGAHSHGACARALRVAWATVRGRPAWDAYEMPPHDPGAQHEGERGLGRLTAASVWRAGRASADQGQGQVHDGPHQHGGPLAQVPRAPGQHLQQHAHRRAQRREWPGQQREEPGAPPGRPCASRAHDCAQADNCLAAGHPYARAPWTELWTVI